MAFLFADSFELISVHADMALRGWTVVGSPIIETGIFKDGAQSVSIEGNESLSVVFDLGSDIMIASFWYYKNHEDAANFFKFKGSGSGSMRLQVQTDDTVDMIDQSSTLHGSSAAVLTSDVWHHIEFKCRFNNSINLGDVELYIDGVLEIQLAATTDTQFSTEDTIEEIQLMSDNEIGKKNYFDSFICWDDGVGDDWNDLRGTLRCETKVPDANGQDADFIGSDADSTNNYLHVDELPLHDSDTTYNESGTPGANDSYNFPDIVAGDVTAIVGVQVAMISKKTGAGAVDLTPFFVDGGIDHLGTEHVLTNGTYTFGSHMYDEDPEATAAWTAAKISSGHFGLRVT